MRLAFLTSHPIQYQAPLFRALARENGVEFRVYFESDSGVSPTHDPEFGRTIQWDVPLLDGYDHVFLPNIARHPGVERFAGLLNPTIATELIRFRPDVIVVHGYAHATEHIAMIVARLLGTPVLITGDSNLLRQRSLVRRAAKRLASIYLKGLVAGALAVGSHSREYFLHYGFRPEHLFLAPYAVDNDFFQSRAGDARTLASRWRKEMGLDSETPVVGFAGKLIPVKACRDLIHAFEHGAPSDAALVIVGDGPLRGELEAQAGRLPHRRIFFRGFVNQREMPAAYALCNVFALPSMAESWGLAINEAMNLAKPVIVSDAVGCAPDLVGPENGWVFPAQDVGRLAAIIAEACADPSRLAAMGAASLARINRWGIRETAAGIVNAARYFHSARKE